MKVAIVHDFLTKLGGAEKVLEAIHEIYPKAPIHTLLYSENGTNAFFENKDYKIIPSNLNKYPQKLVQNPRLFLSKLPRAIEEFNFSEYDFVISSSNSFAHGIITKPKTLHLTYCHSPMRYAWDWHAEYLIENHIGFGLKGLYIRNLLHKTRIWDRVASDRTDKWIANSKNVQKRIEKYYKAQSTIIYPPIAMEDIETTKDIPDDYYVIVSRLEPYKKIDLAIEAFNKLKKELVIIGVGSDLQRLKSLAKSNIEFLGWQSNKSVYEYIKNSKGLIFPGEDDFGIVPVEAMACGRPVVAYKKGGVLETIENNKTGVFFEEDNSESLIEAVLSLEENYTSFTPVECRKQAEKFSKDVFKQRFESLATTSLDEYFKDYKNEN